MSEKAPGLQEYTPTRLEWLTVVLNSVYPQDRLGRDGIELRYITAKDGESIEVYARYYADMDKEYVHKQIDVAKRFALRIARNYGWDSWLKVGTVLRVVKRERESNQ